MAAQQATKAGASSRQKKRALRRVDRRTAIGRRAQELEAIYTEALGGAGVVTDVQRVRISAAAELRALAEHARGQCMREASTPEDVVKLENAANRALRALELGQHKPDRQSLHDYLASKGAGALAPGGPT